MAALSAELENNNNGIDDTISNNSQPKIKKSSRGISGFAAFGEGKKNPPLSTKPIKTKTKDPSKSAQNIIRDISGIGIDLRPPPSMILPQPQPTVSMGFMKPAGVDAPANPSLVAPEDMVVLRGARGKGPGKREREGTDERGGGGEVKKRRKKKNLGVVEG